MLNEKYSFKDFLDKKFTHLFTSEFNNSEIRGSCFYQQVVPNTQVFPTGITGVIFVECNLDNVLVPVGNTIKGGCHRRIMIQNDLEDWIIDDSLKPTEPINKIFFERLGLSVDPKDIPNDFIRRETIFKNDWLRTKDLPEVTDWYLETPKIIKQETKCVTKIILRLKWDLLPDKSILTNKFDNGNPSINTAITDKGEEVVVLKGDITRYTIEGKGVFMIQGRKPRPFVNLSVSFAKEQELAEVK